MNCPQCSSENPEGAKFCFECGAKLAATCGQCSATLPPHAKFCGECGAPVGAAREGAQPPEEDNFPDALQRLVPKELADRLLATRGQVSRERRVVTILFSDVKGSTALAEDLDPEDWMEIMDGAFEVLIEPVLRYEGTLARLMGDAVLAFFGAPIAHEDDAERACRAALEIVEGAREYAARLERERRISGFNVRVGINTGLVVVGEVGTDLRVEYTAMGDAVNLAARMESAAEPGTILVTEDTHKLIGPLFDSEALGPIKVKGRAGAVPTYRVLAPKTVPGKRRGIAGLESPLVGREAELAALAEALERLEAGVGGIVTIVGEAGIGKSRLVAELRKGAAHLTWVEGRCLSYGTSIAYLLWRDVLRGLLGVTLEDAPVRVRYALEERVQALCPEHVEKVYPYLGRLMSLPLEEAVKGWLADLDGRELRERTIRAVELLLACVAADRPLVLVCEDLHWSGPSSLALLEHLLALTGRVPLLVICVFRPERGHGSWQLRETIGRDYGQWHTDLWLQALPGAQSETLVGNLLWEEDLPERLKERILEHAEGNPFFLEEVLRSLIDHGAIVQEEATGRWQATREVSAIAMPDTLQGLLLARIDRLHEEAKRVLQMAAVIGRIFLYRVLAAIAEAEAAIEEQALGRRLVTLQNAEMIRERTRIPELEYIFKHQLTQEAAYEGLLKTRRKALHRVAAEAIEALFSDQVDELVATLAHHYEQAELHDKALPYLSQAAERAKAIYANEEALAFYRTAIERATQLIDADEEATELHKTAARLHEGLGDVLELTGQHDEAQAAYAGALIQIPKGDMIWQARLHRKVGGASRSQRRYEEACRAYDLAETAMGREPDDAVLDWWQEWVQIQLERMELHYWQGQQWREIAELARRTRPVVERYGTPVQRAGFFQSLARMCLSRDHYVPSTETLAYAEDALRASQESGNPVWIAVSQFTLGFTQLWSGNLEQAEERLEASLGLAERTGYLTIQTHCLTYLAVIYRKRRRVQETRRHSSRCLEVATAGQMPVYVAMARANLAWVAWLGGNLSEARENGQAALELWPPVYPFQWTALWPLIGVALAWNQVSEAVDYARALLEPLQQRLPDALSRKLEKTIGIWEGGEPEIASAVLDGAIELAREMGYL